MPAVDKDALRRQLKAKHGEYDQIMGAIGILEADIVQKQKRISDLRSLAAPIVNEIYDLRDALGEDESGAEW